MKIQIKIEEIKMFIIWVCCCILAVYGAGNGVGMIGPIAMSIIVLVILTSTPEFGLLVLISLIPFENCWRFNGNSIRGLMCVAAIFPCIISKHHVNVHARSLLYGFILSWIIFFNDIRYNDIMSIINAILPILYIAVFSMVPREYRKINLINIGYSFSVTTLISDLTTLSLGGGFKSYINDIAYYRFGQESSESLLAGAMSIPIYSCMSIYFLLMVMVYCKEQNIILKIYNIIAVVLHLVFGTMTVSRVFVLGMLVMFVIIIGELIRSKKISITVTLAIIAGIVFAYFIFKNLFSSMIFKFIERFDEMASGSDGRTDIWISIIEYLSDNFKAIFFGEGVISYGIIGMKKSMAFKMTAHNYYLDVIMSVGVVGGVLLALLYKRLFREKNTKSFLAFGLIAIVGTMFFVSGSMNYISDYMCVIFAIIFYSCFHRQLEVGEHYSNKNVINTFNTD